MAIILAHTINTPEIRILQEFRRISKDTISLADLKAVKHPAGGGEAPVLSLVSKGYLVADEGGQNFSLTEKAKEFLSYDPKPDVEDAGGPAEAEA